jgi:hypothetical protein
MLREFRRLRLEQIKPEEVIKRVQTPERVIELRSKQLSHAYGITLEDYNEMMVKQNGVCAICKKENRNGKPLLVDHDHATGVVRGLLCHNCNVILGLGHDSVDVLQNAIYYLTQEIKDKNIDFLVDS